ncbi:unnamed protein product [Dovyalis caffra]|uniref:Uncharacterized protein n=1 Tax=Dovyalis caffra TaxID=77055 RepID=A0AAV1R9W0_9ROSI|nr:unnamed protein product [Dovyalis caffra]
MAGSNYDWKEDWLQGAGNIRSRKLGYKTGNCRDGAGIHEFEKQGKEVRRKAKDLQKIC